jgi:hypothetical protein
MIAVILHFVAIYFAGCLFLGLPLCIFYLENLPTPTPHPFEIGCNLLVLLFFYPMFFIRLIRFVLFIMLLWIGFFSGVW